MKQRLADAVGCNPRWFIQFLEKVIVALLSRERAPLPCEISPAFLDDGVQRIVFLPKERLYRRSAWDLLLFGGEYN
jgi:hypothetical protein